MKRIEEERIRQEQLERERQDREKEAAGEMAIEESLKYVDLHHLFMLVIICTFYIVSLAKLYMLAGCFNSSYKNTIKLMSIGHN